MQSGFASEHWPQLFSSSELLPSSPPYWMMFNSPQQSRLSSQHCSDICEPNPRQRSDSNPAVMHTKFFISNSEDGECATEKAKTGLSVKASSGKEDLAASCQLGQKKAQRAFIPDFLNPPTCLSSLPHQHKKNLQQCSMSVLDLSKQPDLNTESHSKNPSSPRTPDRASTVYRLHSIDNHSTTHTVSENILINML